MVIPEVSWIAIGPELVLAVAAALVLLVEVQWKPSRSALVGLAGLGVAVAFGITLIQRVQAGDAAAVGNIDGLRAFSGMLTLDGFAIFARLALLVITGLGLLGASRLIETLGRRGAEAIALMLIATAGFSIMVGANNLVLMFLGLEVGSISLYVLAGLSRRAESDEAAIKYFLMGSFASAIFVYGVALTFAATGEFGVLEMRSFLAGVVLADPVVLYLGLGLMIVGLGFKISLAPFHAWAPDVYQGAPAGFVGYMAAVAKIAGFAALGRVLLAALDDVELTWLPLVAVLAALSMLVGSVLALVQADVRRMLAYSGVAHAGFIMTGVVGGTTSGILFYVAVYALQLVGAFAVVSALGLPDGAKSPINNFKGLARRSPLLAGSFAVLLLGMAGLPLTSGFIAKFGVFAEAWTVGYRWLVVIGVLASVIAFAFYLRVIVAMYMEEGDEITAKPIIGSAARWVLIVTTVATVLWGILPASLLDWASDALLL